MFITLSKKAIFIVIFSLFIPKEVLSYDEFISIGAGVYIREFPTKKSKVKGAIRFGEIVGIDRVEQGWAKLAYDKGWVKKQFLHEYSFEEKEYIFHKIIKYRYFNKKNSFGDLIEIKKFIDDVFFVMNDEKKIKELEEMRQGIIEKSIEIIPKEKRHLSKYRAWINQNNPENKRITYGPNSPIISNIKGGVNIIYNKENKNKLRITYYRLRGASVDLLTKGLLSKEWEKILGGQQDIINNSVLRKTKEITGLFSLGALGDVMSVSSPSGKSAHRLKNYLNEYVKGIKHKENYSDDEEVWSFYLSGSPDDYSMVYPDNNGIKKIINTNDWPEYYKIYHRCNSYSPVDKSSEPIIWKAINKKDLDNYYINIKKYIDFIYGNYNVSAIYSERSGGKNAFIKYNSEIIEPLRYITRNGMPKDFLFAIGEEGLHGGWEINIHPRNIEIEIAVVENISGQPIAIGDLYYSEYGKDKLVSYKDISDSLESAPEIKTLLLNSEYLASKEKIVIPTRLSFVNTTEHKKCPTPEYPKNKEFVFLMNGYQVNSDDPKKIYKPRSRMIENNPPRVTDRYSYGPAWSINRLSVDNKLVNLRKANFNNFNLSLGNEKGSCPFIYVKDKNSGGWISQGHMLLGATSPSKSREDFIEIKDFSGVLKIKENEDEVAFIKNSYIREVKNDGEILMHKPDKNQKTIVTRDSEKTLNFSKIENNINSRYFFHLEGYYIPFSKLNFKEDFK